MQKKRKVHQVNEAHVNAAEVAKLELSEWRATQVHVCLSLTHKGTDRPSAHSDLEANRCTA